MTPHERQAIVEEVAQDLLFQTVEQFPIKNLVALSARMQAIRGFLETPDVAYVMRSTHSDALMLLQLLQNSYVQDSISEFNVMVFKAGAFVTSPLDPSKLH